jgi:hypothetical protein
MIFGENLDMGRWGMSVLRSRLHQGSHQDLVKDSFCYRLHLKRLSSFLKVAPELVFSEYNV